MKLCASCDKEKPLSCFSFRNKAKGTYSSNCKDCHKIWRRNAYIKDPNAAYERSKEYKRNISDWLKELKADLVCEECGFSHPAALQFHHLEPEHKDFSISSAIERGMSKARILAEMGKCKVICANCHFILHWNESKY